MRERERERGGERERERENWVVPARGNARDELPSSPDLHINLTLQH